MKKIYSLIYFIFALIVIISCSKDEEEVYVPVTNASKPSPINYASNPITIDLSLVPLPKLSDYHFFIGDLKNQSPGYKVIPYKPASSLFSDYAHKKRFVWLPSGTKASYNGADNVLEFPDGAVLIKTFYYDNVQPLNVTKIVETRLLIKKTDGWKAYTYVWNAEQTEAFLETTNNGLFVPITWIENNVTKSISYKIPSQTECVTCHKININQTGEITIPIGPKPQNLNTVYNYGRFTRNQLQYWKNIGYIDSTLPALTTIYSEVDWQDTSKPLELRARSYIDINCAHCHRDGGHCDYVPQRFNFSNSNLETFGICLTPLFYIENGPFVINGGNANNSEMIIRMSSNEGSIMMPIIGRSIVHEEGNQLMRDWINSLPSNCH